MGSKTSLRSLLGRPALMKFQEDAFWPIPDQFMGVEIELEGQDKMEMHRHEMAGTPYWAQHADGSLRNGVEYVLAQPMMGNTLKEAIHYFFRAFTIYTPTARTSIHVHINMLQDEESLEGLKNMVVLYYMFEEAFYAIADENRKWNGYCNAFEDAPPAILQALMRNTTVEPLLRDLSHSASINTNRYYGLNLNGLSRYGTLEFRHLPLVHDENRLFDWMRLIMELKAAANRMADEGTTPSQLFLGPEDVAKLEQYMPVFGPTLLRLSNQDVAFVRMGNVTALREVPVRNRFTVHNNRAWKKFVETQAAGGRAVSVKEEKDLKARSSFQVTLDELTMAALPPTARRRVITEDILVRTGLGMDDLAPERSMDEWPSLLNDDDRQSQPPTAAPSAWQEARVWAELNRTNNTERGS